MKLRLLTLLIALTSVGASVGSAGESTPQQIARRADILLEQAYSRESVQEFCDRNPDALYQVEVEDITIVVRCRAYHIWRIEQDSKDPQ